MATKRNGDASFEISLIAITIKQATVLSPPLDRCCGTPSPGHTWNRVNGIRKYLLPAVQLHCQAFV